MTAADARARAVVRELKAYRPGGMIEDVQRKLKGRKVIKLASNENPLGPSPKAVAVLGKTAKTLHRYPDAGCAQLRQALAHKFKVDPSSLVLGNGSDELIVLALRAFVDPGDEVVVAQPTFLIYALQAQAAGASIKSVPLKAYRYDVAGMRAAVSANTKLVFIANPDNPTGTYVTRKELDAFLRDLPPQTITFLDEAYYEFVDAADYPQTLAYIKDRPVIVTRTLSKAYGLAGLRIGYGIMPPPIAAALNAVREPFNVNSLAQAAAVAALSDTAFLAKTRKTVHEGRRYLERELTALKLRYVKSAANFILVTLGLGAGEIAAALLEQGIMVREMSSWNLSGCLRVSVGTPPENRKFIQALRHCLTT